MIIGSGKLKSTTTTTKKAAATTKKSENSDGKDDSETNVIVATTKSIKENDPCLFKGLMPDIENCQSDTFNSKFDFSRLDNF